MNSFIIFSHVFQNLIFEDIKYVDVDTVVVWKIFKNNYLPFNNIMRESTKNIDG